ncbi:MAG TPA: 3-ketoacyl-ACP reductase [Vicinamibacterales bacterium]|nr:3-ketoacyl-ACP reductase [Vicinamibacterales bacterium]
MSGVRPVAIVTGGTRGIGLGIARALAGDGWDLALCGLRAEDAVRSTLDGLRSAGAGVLYRALDVGQVADHERFVAAVHERWAAIDALVNNAGRAARVRADLLEATEASFDEVLRANLYGPYFLTQRVARALVQQRAHDRDRRSSIVFVTSVSAELASIRRGEYCVSKAGLAMAARLFAVRLAEENIPVYDVRPGIVDTDMTAPVHADYEARIADGLVPARRWGTAEDVGRVVAALLRGDLPYATGSVINVDGGLSIPRL